MKTNKWMITAIVASGLLATGALAQEPSPAPAAPAAAIQPTLVYVPQLPTAPELVSAAAAQGMTVVKIEQAANQVTATFRLSNGQLSVVDYQPMSAIEPNAAPPATATTTVYQTAYPAYYPYYYPWGPYWYGPPVSIGIGFGFHGRWR